MVTICHAALRWYIRMVCLSTESFVRALSLKSWLEGFCSPTVFMVGVESDERRFGYLLMVIQFCFRYGILRSLAINLVHFFLNRVL